jgi:DNA-binding XRE family transcriptional regulator
MRGGVVDREKLGAVLRVWRTQTGLTQEQLAERSGLSVRAIRDLERGKVARPHRESIRLLTEALGLDGDDRESLMRLAGHALPTLGSVSATTGHPAFPSPVGPAAPGVDQPAIDPLRGEGAGGACVDGSPAACPASSPRARRAAVVAAIAAAIACLATAIAAWWPAPVGEISAQPSGRPSSASPSERPAGIAPSDRSGYVARIAADAQIISSTGTALRVDHPVTSGDALVVALMLTSTSAGTIAVTDTAGNRYNMVADVTDPYHHRTALFAAFRVSPLHVGDHFTITWPAASKYHVAVEQFHGISAAQGQASGFGTYDHSNQTLAAGITAGCAPGDLVMAAIGSNTGPGPVLAQGWHHLPELQLSSYRLTIVYRSATGHDGCVLTGVSRAQWETALVSFRSDGPST